jgi:hypothetical protein
VRSLALALAASCATAAPAPPPSNVGSPVLRCGDLGAPPSTGCVGWSPTGVLCTKRSVAELDAWALRAYLCVQDVRRAYGPR